MLYIIILMAIAALAKEEVTLSSYTFVNGRGIQISGMKWKPLGQPVGLVYISHGYAEHMEYYTEIGNALAEAGLLVFGHDHVGHGVSDGERVIVKDFQHYVDDVLQDIQQLKLYTGSGCPVFIFGHSMGGLVGLMMVSERKHFFKGIILTGPMVRSVGSHGPNNQLNRQLVAEMAPTMPSFQAGDPIDPNDVTNNNTITRWIEDDDLFWRGQFKAGWVAASFHAMDTFNSNFEKVVAPLLILHGSEDVFNLLEGSKALVAGASSSDIQFMQLEGRKHHLILDIGGEQVIKIIEQWIMERIPSIEKSWWIL